MIPILIQRGPLVMANSSIYLPGGGVQDSVGAPGNVDSGWKFLNTGIAQSVKTGIVTTQHDWHLDAPLTPPNGYSIKLTASGANLPTNVADGTNGVNGWVTLDTTRTFLNEQSGGAKNILMTWTIQIRETGGDILAEAVYTARSIIIA